MNAIPRLVLTPGEPAGVGPDLILGLSQRDWPAELVIVADPLMLQRRAQQLSIICTISRLGLADLLGVIGRQF